MKPDLVELARRYVDLNSQLEEVRNAMRVALANGADPSPPHPTQRSLRDRARAADEQVVALLREKPMRANEIVTAMSAKTSTVSERLRRLKQKGLIEPCDGGWTATSSP
jgi:predicted Rossmann fold nucleotide-binding protein DprA/Smf involved in DNA uptake